MIFRVILFWHILIFTLTHCNICNSFLNHYKSMNIHKCSIYTNFYFFATFLYYILFICNPDYRTISQKSVSTSNSLYFILYSIHYWILPNILIYGTTYCKDYRLNFPNFSVYKWNLGILTLVYWKKILNFFRYWKVICLWSIYLVLNYIFNYRCDLLILIRNLHWKGHN